MDKLRLLSRVRELYNQGGNIINYLKSLEANDSNQIEDILISYDFQAGSYINSYRKDPHLKDQYCYHLSSVIRQLGEFKSILEAGVGEATTLSGVIKTIESAPDSVLGFDLSWSRIKYANKFLDENGQHAQLFTGDLFNIPLKDSSIDLVYTSHSIEPNGGREREALVELYRVTGKYLVLLEPSYDFANDQARTRMREHGYVTQLYRTAVELDYKIIEHRLFDISSNPLNPTGLIIIEKTASERHPSTIACPITQSDLVRIENMLYAEASMLAYPILQGIPCLLPNNAIVATKFYE